jgi:hypothetical protein
MVGFERVERGPGSAGEVEKFRAGECAEWRWLPTDSASCLSDRSELVESLVAKASARKARVVVRSSYLMMAHL